MLLVTLNGEKITRIKYVLIIIKEKEHLIIKITDFSLIKIINKQDWKTIDCTILPIKES